VTLHTLGVKVRGMCCICAQDFAATALHLQLPKATKSISLLLPIDHSRQRLVTVSGMLIGYVIRHCSHAHVSSLADRRSSL